MMVHYVQDLFHYDGRFWHTLKNLVTRPGLVAKEYMEGKRMRNLEPIRFYVFASTVFFLLFFFAIGSSSVKKSEANEPGYGRRLFYLEQEKKRLEGTADTTLINPLIDSLQIRFGQYTPEGPDSNSSDLEITLFNGPVDSQQNLGWFAALIQKKLEARADEMETEYEGDELEAISAFGHELLHTLPQLFFLSLPFFALFLKLLYWRSTRKMYVEHFIFSIYHYAYLFVIFIFFMFQNWLTDKVQSDVLAPVTSIVTTFFVLYPFLYLLLSMKRFYNDRWGRLIFRYLVLLFLFVMIIIILFIVIAFITFLF
jgi:hypothetical protein